MKLPSPEADALEWLRYDQAGVLTWRQAVDQLSPAKVRHQLATGRWQRICRGVIATFTGPLTPAAHRWVAVLAAGPGAVLAGLAAAREGGFRPVRAGRDVIDVLVPEQRRAAQLRHRLPSELPPVLVRRTTHLPTQDRQRGKPDRTSMPRSLVDAAQWARGDDEARRLLAAGCQQRLVRPEELRHVVARMPKLRRRALLRETIDDVAGGAEALSELDLVALCRRHGLPLPEQQHRRKDSAGRQRFLDAYWPQWRLQVEVDGAHHLRVGQWEADMRRQNELWLAGDRVLRFSSYQVRHHPAEVAAQIRRALIAAGWLP